MSSALVTISAAVIVSTPGWAGLAMTVLSQRRALDKQTTELKAHIDAGPQAPGAPVGTTPSDHREPL